MNEMHALACQDIPMEENCAILITYVRSEFTFVGLFGTFC